MSKNAPDAVARGMAKRILNVLALQSLDGDTMGVSDYCEITESKLKTKIFLLENTQIWYQMALVIFFRCEHRLCKNDHKQFRANDMGLETEHANIELCPPERRHPHSDRDIRAQWIRFASGQYDRHVHHLLPLSNRP